jgi:hypothetical protein
MDVQSKHNTNYVTKKTSATLTVRRGIYSKLENRYTHSYIAEERGKYTSTLRP